MEFYHCMLTIKQYRQLSLAMILMIITGILSGQTPVIYNVGGSGSYCVGGSGLSISLDNSEVGVDYQLKKYGIDEGAPLSGTGSILTWPGQTEGVYEVLATIVSTGVSENMNGRSIVDENPLPVITFGYEFYKTITIDADSVAGTEDLINFPILVSIPFDNDLRTTANGGNVQNINGYDIVFTDNNYNPIPHESMSYNPATGAYSTWVNIPLLSPDTDTDIHMLFGNSGITSDHSSIETWSSNYVQVMHLDGDFTDASMSGNYGLNDGTSDAGGKLGNGRSFDGTDDMIIVYDDPTLDGTNDEATFSLWINWINSTDGDYQIVMSSSNRFETLNGGYEWASQGSGNHYFYPNGEVDLNYNLGPDPFTNNIWQHLSVTFNYGAKEMKIYVDGVLMNFTFSGVDTLWTSLANIDNWLWGGNQTQGTRYFYGFMDEIRVQTVARSGDWLLTEYRNQNNPSGFYSISSETALNAFQDMCQNDSPLSLSIALPIGGTYSGTGVALNSFDPAIAGAGTHPITYSYTDAMTCSSEGTADILVNPTPNPIITGVNSLCIDGVESYTSTLYAGNSYLWTLNAGDASINSGQGTNEIEIQWGSNPGSITLMETIDLTGCSETTPEFLVTIVACQDLVIPEGFSPNNDGLNDSFVIVGFEQYTNIELHVYNIHGTEVYFSNSYTNDWAGLSNTGLNRGTELPTGNYYYTVVIDNQSVTMTGYIYLRRE